MPCFNLLGIEICIPSLDEIVSAIVTPISSFITNGLNGLVSALSPYFEGVVNAISPLFNGVVSAITGFLSDPLGAIQSALGSVSGALSGLWDTITGALGGLWDSISAGLSGLGAALSSGISGLGSAIYNGLSWLGASIQGAISATGNALNGAISAVEVAVSSGLEATGNALLTAFDGMGSAISGFISGVFAGFGAIDASQVLGSALAALGQFSAAIITLGTHHSPITPQQANNWVWPYIDQVTAAAMTLHTSNIIAEGVSLGQIDVSLTEAWSYPSTAAAMALATELSGMSIREGLMPAYKRYILSSYVPNIPPYNDLIEIYVREGYLESHWVEIPEEMISNFRELGFSEEWTKRLWGKHWQYPSPTQLYEMLHRSAGNFPEIGVTVDVLRDMLKLHDYEPKWREPLEAISWNTWRIYDIRTAWEMDLDSEEALVKRLIDTGYNPKDASLLAEVQKMFVLRSEIDKILTETDQDFIEGWISEDQLKLDYEATPYRQAVRDMRIARVKLRRDRAVKQDLKAALTDRFTKGDLSEKEFKDGLSRLGVTQDWIATEVERAEAKMLKKVSEDTTVTTKALTEAKYSRAFKVGQITEQTYRDRLAALKYGSEDITLLVALNQPERPAPTELPTLTLGELKAAFRVGVLTEQELRAELASRLYSAEDINTIVETEKAKIKPAATE